MSKPTDLVLGGPAPGVSTVFMTGVNLDDVSVDQSGLIISIRMLQLEIEETPISGTELKRVFSDMFPPAKLFSLDIQQLPSVYRHVRDFLDRNGSNLAQHSSRRVIMTLATSLYEEAEDRDAAIEIVKGIIADGRKKPTRGDANIHADDDHSARRGVGADKLAHNVAMRFKDVSAKFKGNIGECWQEYVDEYRQVSGDYRMSQQQKLDYLHNLLFGDAKRFYLDVVEGYATNFQQAVDMVEGEYNSIVRQTRVKNCLNSLRMSKFEADGLNAQASLEKAYKIITKLARQVPRAFRGDEHKVEFLRKAVVGNGWATEPLSRIATYNLNFQNLYGELEAALNLHKEARVAVLHDSLTKRAVKVEEELPGVLYQGQGRYITQHKGLGSRTRTRVFNRQGKADPLDVMGCFNCGGDHLIAKCPHPINATKAARNKLDYYARKKGNTHVAHLVLLDVCQQLDGEPSMEDAASPTIHHQMVQTGDEVHLFDALMAKLDENTPESHQPVTTDEGMDDEGLPPRESIVSILSKTDEVR